MSNSPFRLTQSTPTVLRQTKSIYTLRTNGETNFFAENEKYLDTKYFFLAPLCM